MGSAKAQPSCLEKENVKNLRKQGPVCENRTYRRGRAAQRDGRDGSGDGEAGKGTKRELGGRGKVKRSKYKELEK